MNLILNGEERRFPALATIADLVADLELDARGRPDDYLAWFGCVGYCMDGDELGDGRR